MLLLFVLFLDVLELFSGVGQNNDRCGDLFTKFVELFVSFLNLFIQSLVFNL
jgi:hypothetical protein